MFRSSTLSVVVVLTLCTAPVSAQNFFVRGDCDTNGAVGLTDILYLLNYLFVAGAPPDCDDSCDMDNNEQLSLSDAIYGLNYLFLSGSAPAVPFPACGRDTGIDGGLSCASFPDCPNAPNLDPPIVDPLPGATNVTQISFTGTAVGANFVEVSNGQSIFVFPVAPVTGAFEGGFFLSTNTRNLLSFTALIVTPGEPTTRSAPWVQEISHDNVPPQIELTYPVTEPSQIHTTLTTPIFVSGFVNDPLSGLGGLEVTLNGTPTSLAAAAGNMASFGDLVEPDITAVVTVTATDAVGNSATFAFTVNVDTPTGNYLSLISPQGLATGTVGTFTSDIQILATNELGDPISNQLVCLQVSRGDGRVGPDAPAVCVFPDSSGMITLPWRLGSTAGAASDRISISGTQFTNVVDAFGSASAAAPQNLSESTGNYQVAETNSLIPQPLVVIATDGVNPVVGVSVEFAITTGAGTLNGLPGPISVLTNNSGLASVEFEVGATPGQHVVTAQAGFGLEVDFYANAVQRVPGAPTTFGGRVVDADGIGIADVGLTLIAPPGGDDLSADTDIDGNFSLLDIPFSGFVHLHVDGAVAGPFPALEFLVLIIPNAANVMPQTISLPTLEAQNTVAYSLSQETILVDDRIPGLQLLVEPGSMMLNGVPAPDGSLISINPVKADRIPMRLPEGASPPIAFTFQPPNATFDPPVRFCYPNAAGLNPGQTAFLSSFDHDTGRFETVGRGRVSDDGLKITSEPGSGLPHGGWHGFLGRRGLRAKIARGPNTQFDENCEVSFDPTFQSQNVVRVNSDGSFRIFRRSSRFFWFGRLHMRCLDLSTNTYDYYRTPVMFLLFNGCYTPSFLGPFNGPQPRVVDIIVGNAVCQLTSLGQQLQMNPQGEYDNGLILDITASTTGTSYASSNENIVTVSQEGVLEAVAPGSALLTITNDDEIAFKLVTVLPGAFTTLQGSVKLPGNVPASLAGVDVNVGLLTLSNAADSLGVYTTPGVPTEGGPVTIVASLEISGSYYSGRVELAESQLVPSGTTPVGDIILSLVQKRFYMTAASGDIGDTAETRVLLDTDEELQAWSTSVCYPSELSVKSAVIPNSSGYDFEVVNIGTDRVTGQVVTSFTFASLLPATVGHPILDLVLSLDQPPSSGSSYPLLFCGGGTPTVNNEIVDGNGVAALVTTTDGVITTP